MMIRGDHDRDLVNLLKALQTGLDDGLIRPGRDYLPSLVVVEIHPNISAVLANQRQRQQRCIGARNLKYSNQVRIGVDDSFKEVQ